MSNDTPNAPATIPGTSLGTSSGTIMVIDDDPDYLAFLVALLKRAGYSTAGFSDGIDALAAIEWVVPDLIVTDIFMPHIDGFELLRRVKQRRPPVPVVAVSGKTARHGTLYLESIRMLGAIAGLTKPLVGGDLVAIIRDALGGRGSGGRALAAG